MPAVAREVRARLATRDLVAVSSATGAGLDRLLKRLGRLL